MPRTVPAPSRVARVDIVPTSPQAPAHARVVGTDDRLVCDRCVVADSFFTRLRGLMFRRELPAGEGLLIRPAGSVHTCFMRFPIDVVVLDRDMRVVRVAAAVKPWRAVAARRGRAVLELAAGEATRRGVEVGDRLSLDHGTDRDA